MSNQMYPTARQKFGEAGINWTSDDIRAVLVETYTYSDTHEFHDDLTGILATSGNFTGKTNVLGVLDADDVTWSAVAGGDTASGIVIYKWTGTSATSPLIFYFDRSASSVPFMLVTDNGDVRVRWSNGPNKIARI